MKALITLTLLAALTASARAEFYLGASAITTSSSFELDEVDDLDSDELGWKLYVGYNLFKFVGVEGGYRDLGNFSEGGDLGAIDLDLKVIDAAARVYLPVMPVLHVFAKAGYANIAWDGRINIGDEIDNFDEDDWELFYGLGAELNLGRNFAIRAEWERYDTSSDLDSVSAGVVYRF
jgi:OmpA-OmpF porin, OOP family